MWSESKLKKSKIWLSFIAFTGITLVMFAVHAADEANASQMIIQVLNSERHNYAVQLGEIEESNKNRKQLSEQLVFAQNNADKEKARLMAAKDKYNRATDNPDLVDTSELTAINKEVTDAQAGYAAALSILKNDRNQLDKTDEEIRILNNKAVETAQKIQKYAATIFDLQFKQPVWVEGEGEVIATEATSPRDCQTLALNYARRDAMEKAGMIFVSSVTIVDKNTVIQDKIRSEVEALILNQDNTNGYGKVQRLPYGEYGKYAVKLRLYIQNTSAYNPYRGEQPLSAVAGIVPLMAESLSNISPVSAAAATTTQLPAAAAITATVTETASGTDKKAEIKTGSNRMSGSDITDAYVRDYNNHGPGWLQRIQFGGNYLDTTGKYNYSVSMIQPLFNMNDRSGWEQNLFVQAAYTNVGDTLNAGLVYRKMFWDDFAMLGFNAFYDQQFTVTDAVQTGKNRTHQRVGAGMELFAGGLELNVNGYYGISQAVQLVSASQGWNYWQKPANGYDATASIDFSFIGMPWLNAGATTYRYYMNESYQGVQNSNISGTTVNASLQLLPQLQVGCNYNPEEKTTYVYAGLNLIGGMQPALLFADDAVNEYAGRDISYKMQRQVKRNNVIFVENYSTLADSETGAIAGTVSGIASTDGIVVTLNGATANVVWSGNSYSITGVAAGTYNLVLSKAGYSASPASQSVTVGKGIVTTAAMVGFSGQNNYSVAVTFTESGSEYNPHQVKIVNTETQTTVVDEQIIMPNNYPYTLQKIYTLPNGSYSIIFTDKYDNIRENSFSVTNADTSVTVGW